MRENLKGLFSLIVLIGLMLGCSKLSNLAGDNSDKLYFCESYNVTTDKCEGKSTKYSEGFLTVMIDIRPSKKKLNVKSVKM